MHAMMSPQPPAHLPCDAAAAERTLVMGILNVTPDSFSDGGEHYTAKRRSHPRAAHDRPRRRHY